ncbi:MAG: alpha-L-fucosidase [Planctomycetes bacterium]|nr:alpha-L-fucosidase [Planctomycetota bacterium]
MSYPGKIFRRCCFGHLAMLARLVCPVVIFTCLLINIPPAIGNVGEDMETPYLASPERIQWWKDMKFGMFIHWGAWSQTHRGRIWDMTDEEDQAKGEKFLDLYKTFNPVKFNPKEWARLAKNAGMKYVVFVTKHHDGFSNWDTKGTSLRITNPDCPYSKSENPDIVRQIVDAYRDEGIAIGLYYSHIDWFHPDAKIYSRSHWEFDENMVDKAPKRWHNFVEFERSQVEELLTDYGKIDIFWFDISWPYGGYGKRYSHLGVRKDAFELVKLIRGAQPGIIVNNRGVDIHGDFYTPEQRVPEQGLPGNWEANLTISNGGGFWYRGPETGYKTTKELVQMLADITSKGGNFLMNIGPRPDGTIAPAEVDRLKGIAKWMSVNSESIYATEKTVFRHLDWGRCTVKGQKLYLHVFNWPDDGVLKLRGLRNKVTSAYLLADPKKRPLDIRQKKDDILITVGAKAPDEMDSVVAMAVRGVPRADQVIQADFENVITLRADEAIVEGDTARFDYGGGTQRGDFIFEWNSLNDSAKWLFKVRDAGQYEVSLVYAAEEQGVKNPFTVSVAGQTISGVSAFTAKPYHIKGSGLHRTFEERLVGTVDFPVPGRFDLSVKADKIAKKEFMKLKTVKLRLIEAK